MSVLATLVIIRAVPRAKQIKWPHICPYFGSTVSAYSNAWISCTLRVCENEQQPQYSQQQHKMHY